MRVPIGGGAVTRLATIKANWAFLLSLDQDHLYWNGLRTGEIWRMHKAGGAPVRLDDGAHKLMGTATDATYVYASDRSARPAGLLRVPQKGGPATLVSESRALTFVLGVDHGDLYWAERLDGGTGNGWLLRTVAAHGGPTRTLAQLDALPGDAAIERGDAVLDVSATRERGIAVTRHGVLPPVRKLVHMVNGQVIEVDAAALEREVSRQLTAASHRDGEADASPP